MSTPRPVSVANPIDIFSDLAGVSPRLGFPLIRMGEVTSTMDIARQLEALGAIDGTTVIASSQSAGRGRAGRQWQSPAGAGLYCSVLLRPRIPVDRFRAFSLAAGLGMCDALDPTGQFGLQLKWPNDILVRDRKLAGILVTSILRGNVVSSAVLGLGLNLFPDPSRSPDSTSLAELPGMTVPGISTLIDSIFSSLSTRYQQITNGDESSALAGWQTRLALLHQVVTVQDGETSIQGRLAGIDANGSLLLETPAGPRTVTSGELTRGPVLLDETEQ